MIHLRFYDIIFALSLAVFFLCALGLIGLRLANPDMTDARLFLTYWYWYVAMFVAAIIAMIARWKLKAIPPKHYTLHGEFCRRCMTKMEYQRFLDGKAMCEACEKRHKSFRRLGSFILLRKKEDES